MSDIFYDIQRQFYRNIVEITNFDGDISVTPTERKLNESSFKI